MATIAGGVSMKRRDLIRQKNKLAKTGGFRYIRYAKYACVAMDDESLPPAQFLVAQDLCLPLFPIHGHGRHIIAHRAAGGHHKVFRVL